MIDKSNLRTVPTGYRFEKETSVPVASDDFRKEDEGVQFDPEIHLNYVPSRKKFYMSDLGLDDGSELSPVGATYPFGLFTDQAVRIMRHELLNPEAWPRYAYASDIAPCHLRGYVRDYAPFTAAAWKHPKTMEIIAREAGEELQVVIDYELAHINFAAKQPAGSTDNRQVIGWHYDSYPFACVLMLSDTTNMVGGETVFRNQITGEIERIPDPKRGSVTILQGKYIEHQALKPEGGAERITMVTSMVPKDRLKHDPSNMSTTACISNCDELYQEWTCYRLDTLEQRARHTRERLETARTSDHFNFKFDFDNVTKFLRDQQQYIEKTITEMEVEKHYLL